MHILKNNGGRANSPLLVYIRLILICIEDVNYTSSNKFNFADKDVLLFQSIFSCLKTAPHFADHMWIIWTPYQLPEEVISIWGIPLEEWGNIPAERTLISMLGDRELILALPLTRCELTDKLLHLSSSVYSEEVKLDDIFLRFLPALKLCLCSILTNKSREFLPRENIG